MSEPAAFPSFVPDNWKDLPFEHFRDGVEVHYLFSQPDMPEVALLRYAPGASVPTHLHTGLETILVLDGTQSDERGDYPAGSLIFNPKGTQHSVWSETGCTVLIQWECPVEIL